MEKPTSATFYLTKSQEYLLAPLQNAMERDTLVDEHGCMIECTSGIIFAQLQIEHGTADCVYLPRDVAEKVQAVINNCGFDPLKKDGE